MERLNENELLWQYAIISIHNSLQGYITAGLSRDNILDTWKEKQAKKWKKEFDLKSQGLNDPKIPELDYFNELFNKAFVNESTIDGGLIKYLNGLRNSFIHFNTGVLALEKDSAISVCNEAIKAISLILAIFTEIFYYKEEENQFKELCLKAEKLISYQEQLNKKIQRTV
jgi:hypothetical protein